MQIYCTFIVDEIEGIEGIFLIWKPYFACNWSQKVATRWRCWRKRRTIFVTLQQNLVWDFFAKYVQNSVVEMFAKHFYYWRKLVSIIKSPTVFALHKNNRKSSSLHFAAQYWGGAASRRITYEGLIVPCP